MLMYFNILFINLLLSIKFLWGVQLCLWKENLFATDPFLGGNGDNKCAKLLRN